MYEKIVAQLNCLIYRLVTNNFFAHIKYFCEMTLVVANLKDAVGRKVIGSKIYRACRVMDIYSYFGSLQQRHALTFWKKTGRPTPAIVFAMGKSCRKLVKSLSPVWRGSLA
jgi:hypothetical protein